MHTAQFEYAFVFTATGVPAACPPVISSKFDTADLFNDSLFRFFFFIVIGYF
jgi:hypothetical protein